MGNLDGKLDGMPFRFFPPIIVFLHLNILNSFIYYNYMDKKVPIEVALQTFSSKPLRTLKVFPFKKHFKLSLV